MNMHKAASWKLSSALNLPSPYVQLHMFIIASVCLNLPDLYNLASFLEMQLLSNFLPFFFHVHLAWTSFPICL